MNYRIPLRDRWRIYQLARRIVALCAGPSDFPEHVRGYEYLPLPVGDWPNAGGELVVFAGGDSGFFLRYGQEYVRSVVEGTAHRVHLHIYDGDAQCQEQARSWIDETQRHRITLTRDAPEQQRLTPYSHFYYQAGRFLVLPELLRRCAAPVVCTDIDAQVRRPLDPLLQQMNSAPVGLILRLAKRVVWRRILASTSIYQAHPAAQMFAHNVRQVLLEVLKKEPAYACDQLVLYYLYQLMAQKRDLLAVHRLDQRSSDWDCAPDSFVWHSKGTERKAQITFSSNTGVAARRPESATTTGSAHAHSDS